MNPNRKRDLQKKLALGPAPPPPAALAERIKREIPNELHFDAERGRPHPGVSLRIAASILIMMIGAYAMVRLLSRTNERTPAVVSPAQRQLPAAAIQVEKPVVVTAEPKAPESREPAASAPRAAGRIRPRVSGAGHQEEMTPEAQQRTPELLQAESPPAAAAAPAAPEVAGAMKTASVAVQAAPLRVEAVVSPFSGRMIVRIVLPNPEANVVVEGGEKLASDLYAIDGESAIIRLRYRQDGVEQTLERRISRTDVRPWSGASRQMKDAVTRAENPR